MELQRDSDSEGQVEDGVRVALLKLVTEGSRPMGEMSDSWHRAGTQRAQEGGIERKEGEWEGKTETREKIDTR